MATLPDSLKSIITDTAEALALVTNADSDVLRSALFLVAQAAYACGQSDALDVPDEDDESIH